LGRKIKLGIIYDHNSTWIGGFYYIQNLILSLKTLRKEDFPDITILTNSTESFKEFEKLTEYPQLKFFKMDAFFKWKSLFFFLFEKMFRIKLRKPVFDVFYPNPSICILSLSEKNIFWKPDFQELHFPEFFSKIKLKTRESFVKRAIKHGDAIVFSSQDSKNDFESNYNYANIRTFVLPFAVTNDLKNLPEFSELKVKYGLKNKFFILPNQVWIHKNHITVFKAVKELKEEIPNIQIVCTGKEHDYRAPKLTIELKKFIKDNGLESNILMLGFIPRKDLLGLMKESCALIQPSLFEGWNTSIEDAKSMNKFVIASNLAVHREQLSEEHAKFFDPKNIAELKQAIKDVYSGDFRYELNYEKLISNFGKNFLESLK